MTVSGAAKPLERESIRYLGTASGARRGRRPAAGRIERQTRGAMAAERTEQRPGADLAIDGDHPRGARTRRSLKLAP